MPLAAGIRVGVYEILALLGAGGMGEVYRARDHRLNRDVALKVLPSSVTVDPERLARFEREAQVLASLNHPNIAAIYGVEDSGSTPALVMELVEGPTLADRIAKGPIALDEALPIARQIAEALEAAHEQGIIHRDLKPANIKVRDDGTVKVLDFGLAKAMEPATSPSSSAALTNSPTITSPALMTGVGVLLGTAAYMSPEQAKGRRADKQSDIWAFGCVLFEMLTGHRAFDGEDLTEVLAAVVKSSPNWSGLPLATPEAVCTLLKGCLEKRVAARVRDVSAVLFVLDHHANLSGPVASGHLRTSTRVSRLRLALISVAMLAVGTVAGGGAVWVWSRQTPSGTTRTMIATTPATPLTFNGLGLRDLAITPNGSHIIYTGAQRLFVRPLDQLEPTPLVDATGGAEPFTSPDGQWVAFFQAPSAIMKVPISGGPAIRVCTTGGAPPRGATWGEDGTIVFASNINGTLQRVSAEGGDPTDLTKLDVGETAHRWPRFLPGGHAVLFTIATPSAASIEQSIAVLDLRTGARKVLIRGGSDAHYVGSGHLVYVASNSLRAVAFDLKQLAIVGTPVPIVSRTRIIAAGGADLDISRTGTLVYTDTLSFEGLRRKLVWVDRQGHEAPLSAPERLYVYPRASPDGTRVALSISGDEQEIWMWDLKRETLTKTTFSPNGVAATYPAWMPNSHQLLFGSSGRIFLQNADGSGTRQPVTAEGSPGSGLMPYAVSPDGARVIVRSGARSYDLGWFRLDGDARIEPLIRSGFSELNAEIAPNGRWMAYESDESGQREVYVRPFPDVNSGRWPVSKGGGTRPLWSHSGQELFYLANVDGGGETVALMAVSIGRGVQFDAGPPMKLFEGQYFHVAAGVGEGRTYDVAKDDRRFLMIKNMAQGAGPGNNLVVVQHFDEELKRLATAK